MWIENIAEIGAPIQTPDLNVDEFAHLPNHRNSAEVDEPIQQSSPSNKRFLELMKKVISLTNSFRICSTYMRMFETLVFTCCV